MFSVKHEAGSLANAIGIIGKYGYNMTALRSRPMKKHSWQYYFYVEIDGNIESEKGKKIYEIEFYSEGTEYDYEIDANTGKIISSDLDRTMFPDRALWFNCSGYFVFLS